MRGTPWVFVKPFSTCIRETQKLTGPITHGILRNIQIQLNDDD